MKTSDVFGISTEILEPSYVNRGDLDERITALLDRNVHIALRGESKCGKSWLRKKNIRDALVVQCRLNRSVKDLFEDALSQLGLRLTYQASKSHSQSYKLESSSTIGAKMIATLSAKFGMDEVKSDNKTFLPVGENLDNLRFVADILIASNRRLVIEDFHYLPTSERRAFATDLKAFWDYGLFVAVIGIWNENNLLLHLNPDLSGRVEELPIYWSESELRQVLEKGLPHLNIRISNNIKQRLVNDSFNTVGILQNLILGTLDENRIFRGSDEEIVIKDESTYESAALKYAEQLNALYQTFAERVAKGVRQSKKSTGIYAHMLKAVMEAEDEKLKSGMHTDEIFRITHNREPRIQKPNLRTILRKINGLQIDEEGRGLILTYDESKDEVTVVDRQLFLYRKYATVEWPWERIIEEASESSFKGED